MLERSFNNWPNVVSQFFLFFACVFLMSGGVMLLVKSYEEKGRKMKAYYSERRSIIVV